MGGQPVVVGDDQQTLAAMIATEDREGPESVDAVGPQLHPELEREVFHPETARSGRLTTLCDHLDDGGHQIVAMRARNDGLDLTELVGDPDPAGSPADRLLDSFRHLHEDIVQVVGSGQRVEQVAVIGQELFGTGQVHDVSVEGHVVRLRGRQRRQRKERRLDRDNCTGGVVQVEPHDGLLARIHNSSNGIELGSGRVVSKERVRTTAEKLIGSVPQHRREALTHVHQMGTSTRRIDRRDGDAIDGGERTIVARSASGGSDEAGQPVELDRGRERWIEWQLVVD